MKPPRRFPDQRKLSTLGGEAGPPKPWTERLIVVDDGKYAQLAWLERAPDPIKHLGGSGYTLHVMPRYAMGHGAPYVTLHHGVIFEEPGHPLSVITHGPGDVGNDYDLVFDAKTGAAWCERDQATINYGGDWVDDGIETTGAAMLERFTVLLPTLPPEFTRPLGVAGAMRLQRWLATRTGRAARSNPRARAVR